MYILMQAQYPPQIASDVGKTYIEAMSKFPDDKTVAKPIVQACVKANIEGITVTGIAQIKEGKTKEAMEIFSGRMLVFAKLKGFRYSIDLCYDAIEAMSLIGLEAP